MPRAPYPCPQHPDKGTGVSPFPKHIIFRHPGYGREAQPLLILPACDLNDTIDHELARTACAIIACNELDGFFTTDVHGEHRVYGAQLPHTEEGYYFHVPGQNGTFRLLLTTSYADSVQLENNPTLSIPHSGTGRRHPLRSSLRHGGIVYCLMRQFYPVDL